MDNKETYLQIFMEKERVAANKEQTIDVLVRVVPPAASAGSGERPKLNIGIALDRSGSMDGNKMWQAREAAKYCVDEPLPTDRFSAVIFDDHVDVLFTNQPATNKEMLKRGIDRIEARGSTALHQGWVQAGLQVSERLSGGGIDRVLLITDGQANVGETRTDRIVQQAKDLAERGISTSTIGIGRGFNEDLLLPMAEAGQGNAWFVEAPQDMVRIFETELKGLVAQVGHTVTLGITPSPGVRVEDMLNDFEADASGRYILPNLRAGSPLDVLVRLKIPAGEVGEALSAANFELRYTEQATQKPVTVTAMAEVAYDTADAVAELRTNDQVLEAVTLLTNARARKEAMEYMDHGRFEDAQQVLFDRELQTDALYSLAPSLELEQEIEAVRDLNRLIADRSNDMLTRKRMSYERELRRKSR
ncbi:MAG TPA: VWA domain-containing protein [Pyrinomonadaceae bacterium]|nr:VWA domain-containing protein [Pyrinomonadaceae bacterium]